MSNKEKSQLVGTFTKKKDTRGGKKHLANTEESAIAGALYLTPKQLKDLRATDTDTFRVTITKV